MIAFKQFSNIFATGSETPLCQDYEEYEFAESLLEEAQIIDLFAYCKLQRHKFFQYTLATGLSSC